MYKKYFKYITFLFLAISTSLYSLPIKSESGGKSQSNPNTLKELINGQKGILTESRVAIISEAPLKTQNYTNEINIDFSKFKKITLKTVILETLSLNNTLKAAKEKLIQSKILYKEANSGYLPTVDFELATKVTKRFGIIDTSDDKRDTKIVHDQRYKFTVNQPLYSGGTTALKIKNFETKYQQAKYKYEIVLNQTIQKAIDAYFKLLFNIQKVEINTKNMEKLQKILSISQVKYDSGAMSVGDLAAIKASVANGQTELNNIKSQLANSIDYYLYLLSDKFQNTKPYEKNFSIKLGTYDELKSEIIEKNLILINYRLNILGTKYKLQSFKYGFKPKIDLQMKMSHILNQEDFTDDQEDYSAKVIFRYNLYNKGKDVNKIVTTHSTIEELQYRYQEEIKKISWDTSKIYNSLKALSKSLKSVKDEIKSSKEMTDVYWEGFQLGEQDLQILLQGEKQLNSAQLNLLKFKKDYLTNMFKVLNQTNKLSSFFGIDPYSPYYIDYTNVEQVNTSIEMNSSILNDNIKLSNAMDSYLEVIHDYTFNDIVNFKDNFLQSKNDNYTIVISDFKNTYKAYDFIKENRLLTNAFPYDYYDDNGTLNKISLDKKLKVKTNIAHGIYKTKEEAQVALNNMFNTNKNLSIKKVNKIKNLYSSYVDGLQVNINPYIIKPVPKKVFRTDPEFKKKFLNSKKDNFTLNITSVSSMKKAEKLLKDENITNNSFVFKYGRNGEWIKIMTGVYSTYSDAVESLNKKTSLLNKYHPIIEKISRKQDLYNQYINFNTIKKPKTKLARPSKNEVITESNRLVPKNKRRKLRDPKPKKEILPFKNKRKKLKDPKPKKEILIKKVKTTKELLPFKINTLKVNTPKIDLPSIDVVPKKDVITLSDAKKDPKPKKEILEKKDPKPKKEKLDKKELLPYKMTESNVKKITFKKPKKYKNNFEKKFFNSKKGSYSLILGTINKNKIKYFIKRFILDDNYIISKYDNKYRVIYGIYPNRAKAIKALDSVHPKIVKKAKLILIESIK